MNLQQQQQQHHQLQFINDGMNNEYLSSQMLDQSYNKQQQQNMSVKSLIGSNVSSN